MRQGAEEAGDSGVLRTFASLEDSRFICTLFARPLCHSAVTTSANALFVNEPVGRTNYPRSLYNRLIPCYPIVSDVDPFSTFETFAARARAVVSGRLSLFKTAFRMSMHGGSDKPLRNFSFAALRQSIVQAQNFKAERFNCSDEPRKFNICV